MAGALSISNGVDFAYSELRPSSTLAPCGCAEGGGVGAALKWCAFLSWLLAPRSSLVHVLRFDRHW